jgi:hypothetical protein
MLDLLPLSFFIVELLKPPPFFTAKLPSPLLFAYRKPVRKILLTLLVNTRV